MNGSKFVRLQVQANPTAAEVASHGKCWAREVSVIEVAFYYGDGNKWIGIDDSKTYVALQKYLTHGRSTLLSVKKTLHMSKSNSVNLIFI